MPGGFIRSTSAGNAVLLNTPSKPASTVPNDIRFTKFGMSICIGIALLLFRPRNVIGSLDACPARTQGRVFEDPDENAPCPVWELEITSAAVSFDLPHCSDTQSE